MGLGLGWGGEEFNTIAISVLTFTLLTCLSMNFKRVFNTNCDVTNVVISSQTCYPEDVYFVSLCQCYLVAILEMK